MIKLKHRIVIKISEYTLTESCSHFLTKVLWWVWCWNIFYCCRNFMIYHLNTEWHCGKEPQTSSEVLVLQMPWLQIIQHGACPLVTWMSISYPKTGYEVKVWFYFLEFPWKLKNCLDSFCSQLLNGRLSIPQQFHFLWRIHLILLWTEILINLT